MALNSPEPSGGPGFSIAGPSHSSDTFPQPQKPFLFFLTSVHFSPVLPPKLSASRESILSFLFLCPQINEEISVKHLPSTEPDPHVVRIGWSLDSCSTQLGKGGQPSNPESRAGALIPGFSSFLSFCLPHWTQIRTTLGWNRQQGLGLWCCLASDLQGSTGRTTVLQQLFYKKFILHL